MRRAESDLNWRAQTRCADTQLTWIPPRYIRDHDRNHLEFVLPAAGAAGDGDGDGAVGVL